MDTKQKNSTGKSGSRPSSYSGSKSRKSQSAGGSSPSGKHSGRRSAEAAQQAVKATPDVVYLAPKPFSRNRLILHLTTVVAVVIALILGLSVFFKVETIYVSGTEKYSAWEIQQAAGIQTGDNLLTFNRAKAAGKVISALPYVKSVRIGINLPDTVNIEIVEVEVTYAVKDTGGSWWLVSADGKVVEKAPSGGEESCTRILGVELKDPVVGQQASAYQSQQSAVDEEGNTVPVTVTAADRLTAATDIASFLEANGIYGDVTSIDVNDLGSLELMYGAKYCVHLGSTADLGRKISILKAAAAQMEGYDSGTLDISDPSQVSFKNEPLA